MNRPLDSKAYEARIKKQCCDDIRRITGQEWSDVWSQVRERIAMFEASAEDTEAFNAISEAMVKCVALSKQPGGHRAFRSFCAGFEPMIQKLPILGGVVDDAPSLVAILDPPEFLAGGRIKCLVGVEHDDVMRVIACIAILGNYWTAWKSQSQNDAYNPICAAVSVIKKNSKRKGSLQYEGVDPFELLRQVEELFQKP